MAESGAGPETRPGPPAGLLRGACGDKARPDSGGPKYLQAPEPFGGVPGTPSQLLDKAFRPADAAGDPRPKPREPGGSALQSQRLPVLPKFWQATIDKARVTVVLGHPTEAPGQGLIEQSPG